MSQFASKWNDAERKQLKEIILKNILSGEPLPGSNTPVALPDFSFFLTQPVIYLLDEDINNALFIEKINKPLRSVSLSFLEQVADQQDKAVYLQFGLTELAGDHLLINLETKVVSSQRVATIGSIQMKFENTGNSWLMTGQPISLSA